MKTISVISVIITGLFACFTILAIAECHYSSETIKNLLLTTLIISLITAYILGNV